MANEGVSRRGWLRLGAAAAAAAAAASAVPGGAIASPRLTRPFAASGERIPAVGLGTWLTFDVATGDAEAMARRRAVLEAFFAGGGRLVDASPMYGRAEEVLGALRRAGDPPFFSATKVWTPLAAYGPVQMRRSLAHWGLPRVDLMQVHNLLGWQAHLKTLRQWQEEGRLRHIGISTSHGRDFELVRRVVTSEKLQCLQITYSPADASAEPLIALAADRGLAVIVNRPFDGGALLQRLAGRPLPALAAELGCTSWAALVLKWELANPAVTCAIPATTNPRHAAENVAAMQGPLPDARQRAKLLEAILA
jgi:diketogulonate reductase-like aldo/keto reductase